MTFDDELKSIQDEIKGKYNFLARISISLYHKDTDVIKTFLTSKYYDSLSNYSAKLAEIPSLSNIATAGKARVINDIEKSGKSSRRLTKVLQGGYKSSYTVPMMSAGELSGFIFFNSKKKDSFSADVIECLDVYGRMIGHYISGKLQAIKTIKAALNAMQQVFGYRDSETADHLDRMSHYSWLIARQSASKYSLSDEWIEHILLFSPLHDVGKIAIPEDILFKPGKLTPAEFKVIETHTVKGREIIECVINNFGLHSYSHIDMLMNIVEHHHESVDGNGYPHGLYLEKIPLEARIVAVADVFDALTSDRPYKTAMSNDDAINIIKKMSGKKLDQDLVEIFINCMDQVSDYQSMYRPDKKHSQEINTKLQFVN